MQRLSHLRSALPRYPFRGNWVYLLFRTKTVQAKDRAKRRALDPEFSLNTAMLLYRNYLRNFPQQPGNWELKPILPFDAWTFEWEEAENREVLPERTE